MLNFEKSRLPIEAFLFLRTHNYTKKNHYCLIKIRKNTISLDKKEYLVSYGTFKVLTV